ncbi:MAG TPA: BrnT family toxin [Thermoanaerobaculia bacterium]|nr:BrnT family toxin [Thermoanaerobaculia bacterium]
MTGETEGTEFEWDAGNAEKNWLRHRVSQAECEQVFFNRPLVAAEDVLHSSDEPRFFALGQSDAGRPLFVVYTLRGEKVRVISARDMTRRERKEYEHVRAQELAADPEV